MRRFVRLGATDTAGAANVVQSLLFSSGTKTPTEMYEELAPTIESVNRQYQKASPAIDWLLANWPLALIGAIALGLGTQMLAMSLYERYVRK